MKIAVRLSGALRVVVGAPLVELSFDTESTTLGDALDALCARYPRARRYVRAPDGALAPGLRALLNERRLDDGAASTATVRDGDRLALLMPIAGG